MTAFARLLSTAGYVGFAPIAPGTWGSAVGLLILLPLRWYGSPAAEAVVMLALLAAGIWSAGVTGREMGDEDPGPVVIDEVAGMLITLLWIPVGVTGAVLGFLLFRVLDIVKPFPARQCERLPGGWGVMLDDVMAGIYGQVAMRIAVALAPAWFL
ncbi:MAG: phosphatidylglycerophosphatase A [Vicinamibacterales bacterium]